MTSKEAKVLLMGYFMFDRNFVSVMTEFTTFDGIADIFAVDPKFFCYEVEIKVSKADLESELATIRFLRLTETERQKAWDARREVLKHPFYTKSRKHEAFLTGFKGMEYIIKLHPTPNKFYFAVPLVLKEHALTTLDGTPYGLIVLSDTGASVVKKANFLHKTPIEGKALSNSLRKVATENYFLRKKLCEPVPLNA